MDNLFVVHSSAVQSPKLNFIFLGGAGSGKTTTMLELINRHNFQFISNNKTVLSIDATGDLAIRAGTSGISVRKHLAIRNDLLRLSSSNKLEENYSRKMVTVSKKYVANLSNNKPIIIIDLLLNSGCNIFKVMDRDTAFIKLCPILMNVVDREVALFNWKEPLVTSFNNYAYKKKTLLAAHNIIQKNNIYSGLGSIAFITREIIKLNNSWK